MSELPILKKSQAIVFEHGCIVVKLEGYPEPELGNGHMAMQEKNLQWDQDDETGAMSAWVSVARDDFEFIRDELTKLFPTDKDAEIARLTARIAELETARADGAREMRERCAQVCRDFAAEVGSGHWLSAAREIEQNIKAIPLQWESADE